MMSAEMAEIHDTVSLPSNGIRLGRPFRCSLVPQSVPFTSTTLLKTKESYEVDDDTPPDKVFWDQFPASYRVDDDLHAPHGIPPFDLMVQELEPKRLHHRM